MSVKIAYNKWAAIYDSNENKTRDAEAFALRDLLADISFETCLEIGCGTGKNTAWLANKAVKVTAVDFSNEMLLKAKEKLTALNISFIEADITKDWHFVNKKYDLVGFSLVLEHFEEIDTIAEKVTSVTKSGSYLYIGELHPFKQYMGSKARFKNDVGEEEVLTCYTHHFSDYTKAIIKNGFQLLKLKEYFDENNRAELPRIIGMLFRKN